MISDHVPSAALGLGHRGCKENSWVQGWGSGRPQEPQAGGMQRQSLVWGLQPTHPTPAPGHTGPHSDWVQGQNSRGPDRAPAMVSSQKREKGEAWEPKRELRVRHAGPSEQSGTSCPDGIETRHGVKGRRKGRGQALSTGFWGIWDAAHGLAGQPPAPADP